jgi:voltage-gated potassium channel
MLMQPHVSEFLDVITHGNEVEFRLSELHVEPSSVLAGHTLRDVHLRERTGALVLAIRDASGEFNTNPAPHTVIAVGDILIVIGTAAELAALVALSRL